jgi:hypothetical protein
MDISLRDIIFKISQLNAVHRYYIYKSVPQGCISVSLLYLNYLSSHDSCTQRELADYLTVFSALCCNEYKKNAEGRTSRKSC